MNILYITYDGLTDQLGQSQIIPYLSGLSQQGFAITIISCEKEERFLKEEIAIKTQLDAISWHPVLFTRKPPILSTLINMRKMWKAAVKICSREKIKIVHCRSTLAALIGMKVKNRYGAKLIFDMRGFWADERVEGNLWPLKNPLYRFIYNYVKEKESKLLKESDHVISLTHAGKKIITENDKTDAPVTVIPCCTDLQLFDPAAVADRNTISRKDIGIGDDIFVLIYIGSIGTWYMLNEMLDFFKVLHEMMHGSVFLFITNEPKELINEEASRLGIKSDAIIVRSAGRKEVPSLLALSDASIFFIRPGHSKKASSPVKMGESFAMGIPVICNAGIGDNDEIIKNNQLGWITESFDAKAYKVIVEKLLHRKPLPGHIRKVASEIFALNKGIELYAGIYNTLLNDDTSHS